MDRPLTILVIGTLPPPLGGAGVSLQHLVNTLAEREDVEVIVVNTSGVRGHPLIGPFRFATIVWRIINGALRADVVSLQPVPTGLPIVGPFAWAAAWLWGKPFMIRMFGGEDFRDVRGIRGALVRFLVGRTDLYLAQTKALVRSAKESGSKRVEWLATSRPMPPDCPPVRKKCRRFVFLSHVRWTKGIREVIEAGERCDEGVSVHVYGPFHEGVNESHFQGLRRVEYRGVVPPEKAADVLKNYDALLFPTYWPGEGYPGVILEAFGAGLPVLTTNWMAIPEVVDNSCGILIDPKDAEALYDAMKHIVDDDSYYEQLQHGARAKRDFFDSARWVNRFVELCRSLVPQLEPLKAKG